VENGRQIDARGRRDIASATAVWLATQPQKGSTIRIGSALLEVLVVGGDHVSVTTLEAMHIVMTPPKLAENFEEKTRRYLWLGLPLIVAAVKHHRAEIHAMDVEDVLFAEPNGVFASRPDLSAAIWIEPHHLPEPVINVWGNPSAKKPVPAELLQRLTTATL
jgi:hypothetical protein